MHEMGIDPRFEYHAAFARIEMSTWWEERSARVGRAAAVVATQANCSTNEALTLLRRWAEETGRDLEEAALAVVGGRISFGSDIRSPASGPMAVCADRK
jgi:hypothetical protein